MIPQKASEYVEIPKEIGKINGATYLSLTGSQCIAAYNQNYLYFMEVSENPIIRYSTFAIPNIIQLIGLVRGYLLVINADHKMWLMEVRNQRGVENPQNTQPQKKQDKGLLIQCFLRQTVYTSYFIREVSLNMVELQIYTHNAMTEYKNILIYQFTINQKVGVMGYTVDSHYKIIKTSRKQLYGSKVFYEPTNNQIIKFKNFSDSQLMNRICSGPFNFVVPVCKVQEYYGINKNMQLVNLENQGSRKKMKDLIPQFDSAKCVVFMNYLLFENSELKKVFLYSFQQNMKCTLLAEEELGYIWSIAFNGRMIGIDQTANRVKICCEAKIQQLGISMTPFYKKAIDDQEIISKSKDNNKAEQKQIMDQKSVVSSQQTEKQQKKPFKPSKIISRNKVLVSKESTKLEENPSMEKTIPDPEAKQEGTAETQKFPDTSVDKDDKEKVDTEQKTEAELANKKNNTIDKAKQSKINKIDDKASKGKNIQQTTVGSNKSGVGVDKRDNKTSEHCGSISKSANFKTDPMKTGWKGSVFQTHPHQKQQTIFTKKASVCETQISKQKKEPPSFFKPFPNISANCLPQPPFPQPPPSFNLSGNPFTQYNPFKAKQQLGNEDIKKTENGPQKQEKEKISQNNIEQHHINQKSRISEQYKCEPLYQKYSNSLETVQKYLQTTTTRIQEYIKQIPNLITNNFETSQQTNNQAQALISADAISKQINKQTQIAISDYMSKKLTTRVDSYFKHIMNDTKKIYDDTFKFYADRKKETVISLQTHFEEKEHLINQIREISGDLIVSVESTIAEGEDSHALMLSEWNKIKSGIEKKLEKNQQVLEDFTHHKSQQKVKPILEQLAQIKQLLKSKEEPKAEKKPRKVENKRNEREQAKRYHKREQMKKQKKHKLYNHEDPSQRRL